MIISANKNNGDKFYCRKSMQAVDEKRDVKGAIGVMSTAMNVTLANVSV